MTREQRAERIWVLTRELSALLAEEPGVTRPATRVISGAEIPPWVRDWFAEQLGISRETPRAN
jgi:hypothetical protein